MKKIVFICVGVLVLLALMAILPKTCSHAYHTLFTKPDVRWLNIQTNETGYAVTLKTTLPHAGIDEFSMWLEGATNFTFATNVAWQIPLTVNPSDMDWSRRTWPPIDSNEVTIHIPFSAIAADIDCDFSCKCKNCPNAVKRYSVSVSFSYDSFMSANMGTLAWLIDADTNGLFMIVRRGWWYEHPFYNLRDPEHSKTSTSCECINEECKTKKQSGSDLHRENKEIYYTK